MVEKALVYCLGGHILKHVNNSVEPIYLTVIYLCGGTYLHSVQWISYSGPR